MSLSLLSGGVFSYVLPAGAGDDASLAATIDRIRTEAGPAAPVMEFLSGQGRDSLSASEFQRFLDAGTRRVPIGSLGIDSGWEATRILDLHVAALLWRLFGISWPILFGFYALLSTAACASVFGITARLTRSPWGGLLGALGFTASPLERDLGAWSFRDASPLWFAALGILVLLSWVKPSPSWRMSWLRWAAIGATSVVGLGWRPDAYLLASFSIAGLVALLLAARVPPSRILVAALLFVGGAVGARAVIGWLGPASPPPGSAGFHIAWYGDEARSNLLGTENLFQVQADDQLVVLQANYFRLRNGSSGPPSVEVYDPLHLSASRAMYFEMARYHAYTWWRSFPQFLGGLFRIDRSRVPPHPIGSEASTSSGGRSRLEQFMARCVQVYLAGTPWLLVLGVVWGVSRPESRSATLLLGANFVYYGAALLAVLPEPKHWAPLLLPLHVLSAAGVWLVACGLWSWRGTARSADSARCLLHATRAPLAVAVVLALSWGGLGLLTHGVSRAQRQNFVRSVLALDRQGGVPADSPKLHTVSIAPDGPPLSKGYLFAIRAGRRPADLFCVHLRQSPQGVPLYYYTRHRISPDRSQLFFVAPVAGATIGERRPYTLHIRVRGSATFSSVAEVDLSRWTVGLPLSLVFSANDSAPGGERIDDGLPVTASLGSLEAVSAIVGHPHPP